MNESISRTVAEAALDLADAARAGRGEVQCYELPPGLDLEVIFGRVRLSLDFASRPRGFQLRAFVEGWDLLRLVREMY